MAESIEPIRSEVAELAQMLDGMTCGGNPGEQENKRDDEVVESCPFLDIPVEVFLHICTFLDSRFITQTLSKVCQRFSDILSDDCIWKSRIAKRVRGVYPALPVNSQSFDWGYACTLIEEEYNLWHNKDDTMKRIILKDLHNSTVYAVLLMKSGTLCISGSGDGSLAAWDLNEAVLEGPTPSVVIPGAHKDDVRDLTTFQDKLYSCSWDRSVKSWDVEEGLRELSVFYCNGWAQCMASISNVMAVGLLNGLVTLFDPRMQRTIASYRIHTDAVLSVAMMDSYIISASYDKTFGVWDFRNCRQVSKQPLYSDGLAMIGHPSRVSYSNNILYVGDMIGRLHLIDPSGETFNIVETTDVGRGKAVLSIRHSPGSTMTSLLGGTMLIAAPTRSLEPITKIKIRSGNITNFDYKHNVLAMGSTGKLVEVWLPKYMHDT